MINSKPYRVGIIGLGRVAWMLEDDPLRGKPCTHAGCWAVQPGVEIVAGCDIDPDRREAFGSRFGVKALYDDYREMLAREDLDFVSICAYATQRCDMVLAAANAGVRGIWCEKAAATSLQEFERMADALERKGIPMIVSYMRRWEDRYRQAAQLLTEDRIGRLQTINVHFTGNMLHTGTHAFDLLRLFAGEVSEVQAWLRDEQGRSLQSGYRFGGDDCFQDYGGNAILHFENGAMAMIHGEDRDYFRFEFELLGSAGMLRLGNTQTEMWMIGESHYSAGLAELQPAAFPAFEWNNSWTSAVAELVAAAREGTPVGCSLDDARQALRIGLAMHASHRQGNRPVSLQGEVLDIAVNSR